MNYKVSLTLVFIEAENEKEAKEKFWDMVDEDKKFLELHAEVMK